MRWSDGGCQPGHYYFSGITNQRGPAVGHNHQHQHESRKSQQPFPTMAAAHSPPPPPPHAESCYRSPQRTPTNNYASTKTPILSAKRPKRWSTSPKPGVGATATPSSTSGSSATPAGIIKKKLHAAALSPMHNVRPVPRDSHHVPIAAAVTATNHNKHNGCVPATTTSAAATASATSSSPAVNNSTNELEIKNYRLAMIEEIRDNRNDTLNSAASGGGEDEETAELSSSNNGTSSASWVGRKVDAIFSPVLSFLSGTTTTAAPTNATATSSTGANCAAAQDVDEDYNDDNDEGRFIQRSPTTHSTNLDDESESYMHDEGDEENRCNVNNDIATSSAWTVPRRSSSTSSTTMVDVDGDVTMAENIKLHYLTCRGDDDEVVDAYHDEESPPTPTKYEHYHPNNGKNHQIGVSSRKDEEGGQGDDDAEEEEEEEFNPYLFIKCLPPYHYAIPPGWISRPKALPPLDTTSFPPIPPICLVLDLDETLVHCTVEEVSDADMIFPVEFHGVEYKVHVRCRPYLREFLEAVSEKFEVVIFTASQQVYADKLLDKIDPGEFFIDWSS